MHSISHLNLDNYPKMDAGIDNPIMIVALKLRKNNKSTMTAMMPPIIILLVTPSIASSIVIGLCGNFINFR